MHSADDYPIRQVRLIEPFGAGGGPDLIARVLAHELSDCLWSVLVLADKYGVNLEASFLKTMDQLEKRIKNEASA